MAGMWGAPRVIGVGSVGPLCTAPAPTASRFPSTGMLCIYSQRFAHGTCSHPAALQSKARYRASKAALDPTATLAARVRGVRYLTRQRTFGPWACLRKNWAVLDPSLTWTVLGCCSAPGSSSAGPSAVAICAVIGGNARKPGVGRLTVEHKSACGRPLVGCKLQRQRSVRSVRFFH